MFLMNLMIKMGLVLYILDSFLKSLLTKMDHLVVIKMLIKKRISIVTQILTLTLILIVMMNGLIIKLRNLIRSMMMTLKTVDQNVLKDSKNADLENVVIKEKIVVVIGKKKAHVKESLAIETMTGKMNTVVIKRATGKVKNQTISMMTRKKKRIFMEDGKRQNIMKKKRRKKLERGDKPSERKEQDFSSKQNQDVNKTPKVENQVTKKDVPSASPFPSPKP